MSPKHYKTEECHRNLRCKLQRASSLCLPSPGIARTRHHTKLFKGDQTRVYCFQGKHLILAPTFLSLKRSFNHLFIHSFIIVYSSHLSALPQLHHF